MEFTCCQVEAPKTTVIVPQEEKPPPPADTLQIANVEEESEDSSSEEEAAPTSKGPPKRTDTAGLFTVRLKKKQGEKWNMDVDYGPQFMGNLKVHFVDKGPVKRWNKANPEKAIEENDHIVEINGTPGTPMQMATELGLKNEVELVIRKAVTINVQKALK